MSVYAKFKSKIKSARNMDELQEIYIEASEYMDNNENVNEVVTLLTKAVEKLEA